MRRVREGGAGAARRAGARARALAGYGERRVTQLSGGQQQRVALARAVVFDPPRAAHGRASRRARQAPPRGDADRAQAHPAAAADHGDLRDPRPGRGADHGRPDRGPAAMVSSSSSDPRSRSTSGPSTHSWPASSVRRTSSTASSSRKPGRAGVCWSRATTGSRLDDRSERQLVERAAGQGRDPAGVGPPGAARCRRCWRVVSSRRSTVAGTWRASSRWRRALTVTAREIDRGSTTALAG